MSKQSENIETITNYLHDNYYDDCERMSNIKMIQMYATHTTDLPQGWQIGIDKIALFNNIKKSQPPKVDSMVKEFVEGVNFIMFLDKTSKDWDK